MRSRPPSGREPAENGGHRLIVGLQPVREAVRAHGAALSAVWLDSRDNPRLDALARFAQDSGVPHIERVSRAALDRLSAGVQHQGAAARAPSLRLLDPTELLAEPALLAVALDGVQDPQNFGAAIRSAVALANAAVIWGEHASAPLSLATFRASAGAIEHARLCRVRSLTGTLSEAVGRGATVVGLDASAERMLHTFELGGPTIIVVGSEHTGLGRAVRRTTSGLARLGPRGGVDSLNASAAAAVALYEASIQRIKSGA
jgi:23S rRNA (guanosine2251-2'-O)-methyltransferase